MEDLLSEWDLVDVAPKQGLYTWANRRDGDQYIVERLDHFLINNDWILKGLDIFSCILAFGESNHKPVTLSMEDSGGLGSPPFSI
jgi:hypothetical protein